MILFCGKINLDWGPITYLLDICHVGGCGGGNDIFFWMERKKSTRKQKVPTDVFQDFWRERPDEIGGTSRWNITVKYHGEISRWNIAVELIGVESDHLIAEELIHADVISGTWHIRSVRWRTRFIGWHSRHNECPMTVTKDTIKHAQNAMI